MNKYDKLLEYLKNNQITWLITGAAGFIGSNLLEMLLVLNQKIVGIDNFDTGHQYNIDQAIKDANKISGKDLTVNFKFIHGDIAKLDDCKKACNTYDPKHLISKGMDEAIDWYIINLSKKTYV